MVNIARVPGPLWADADPLGPIDEGYETYLVRRLLEELEIADSVADPSERSIHLQACRHYRDQLNAFDRQQGLRIAAALRALRLQEEPGSHLD